MEKYHIKLTSEEASLVENIDLRLSHDSHDEAHAAYLANKEPILALLRSLSERDGVPTERLKYWNDPGYCTARGKASHKGLFEKNGCMGEDIYTDPDFRPYLRYLLFGADLPDEVVAAFEDRLEQAGISPDWFTSGDYAPTWKAARDVARKVIRQTRFSKSHVAEEFLKLCLDMGLGIRVARSVRDQVMKV